MQVNAINSYANSTRAKNNNKSQQSFGMAWRVQEGTLLEPEIHAVARVLEKRGPLDDCEGYIKGINNGRRRILKVVITDLKTKWEQAQGFLTANKGPVNKEPTDLFGPTVIHTHSPEASVDEVASALEQNVDSALAHYDEVSTEQENANKAIERSLATIKEASK